jgi:hypothetical protein
LSGSLPTIHRYARLFISTSPTVSSDPKDYVFTYTTNATSTTVSASMDKSTFNAFGINSGLTAYIVAYGEGFGTGSYVDLSTGRSYYPCINPAPSNVVSAIVP